MFRAREYGRMPLIQVDAKTSRRSIGPQVKHSSIRDQLSHNERTKHDHYFPLDRRGNKRNESNSDPSKELSPKSGTTHSRSTSMTRTTPSRIWKHFLLETQSCPHRTALSLQHTRFPQLSRKAPVGGCIFSNRDLGLGSEVGDNSLEGDFLSETYWPKKQPNRMSTPVRRPGSRPEPRCLLLPRRTRTQIDPLPLIAPDV